jgi:hypothetical protein
VFEIIKKNAAKNVHFGFLKIISQFLRIVLRTFLEKRNIVESQLWMFPHMFILYSEWTGRIIKKIGRLVLGGGIVGNFKALLFTWLVFLFPGSFSCLYQFYLDFSLSLFLFFLFFFKHFSNFFSIGVTPVVADPNLT